MSRTILLLAFALLTLPLRGQTIFYVNHAATGVGNGSSWADAFRSLQDAIAAAAAGDEIWVAGGIYRPDDGASVSEGDREASFHLKSGVRVHGGFAGSESGLTERDPLNHATILSGDLAADDDGFARREDNTYHVVVAEGADASTLLEGVVIGGGRADGVGADSLGGGILVTGGSPAIMNTRLIGNYGRCGGGIAVEEGGAQLVNVILSGNRARQGGGVCNVSSSPEIVNVTVTANAAEVGAGIFNRDASPTISNSLIARNRALSDMLDCEIAQYPCTMADTDTERLQVLTEILTEAGEMLSSHTFPEIVSFLQSHPEVVEVSEDVLSIRFRARGTGPAVVYLVPAASGDTTSNSGNLTTLFEVVGEDQTGDGVVDNLDFKRALVLNPILGESLSDDVTQALADQLNAFDAYEGHVDFKANRDRGNPILTVADFSDWEKYDLIHLMTHGARMCWTVEGVERCGVVLSSGELWDVEVFQEASFPGIVPLTVWDPNVPDRHVSYRVGLSDEFFRSQYGSGLDKAILILMACESGGLYASELASAIGGEDFVMTGWTEPASIDTDIRLATVELYVKLMQGLTVSDGVQAIEDAGITPTPSRFFVKYGRTYGNAQIKRYAPRGGDQRLIELPTILHEGEEMVQETDITTLVEGAVGDGENDRLNLRLRVRGVTPDTRGDFVIRYALDGRKAASTHDLTDAIQVHEYAYEVEHTVDVGFPIVPGPIRLEAIVDLPEGGESRFQVDVAVGRCYWRLSMGGTHAGDYEGKYATIVDQGGLYNLVTLQDEMKPTPITMIFMPIVPEGPSGPYSLGDDEKQDGAASLNFVSVASTYPFFYQTGNSEDVLHDNVVVFTEPSPSSLHVVWSDDVATTGRASGSVWGLKNPDPTLPSFETADWNVQFKAENGLNPDGSPNLQACGL